MPDDFHPIPNTPAALQASARSPWLSAFGAWFLCLTLLGGWLIFDLTRSYERAISDTFYRAIQRSQIIGQAFRTEVLAADYVLRDVLGHIQDRDLAFPDPQPDHALRMTSLLRDKANTVPDFVSMVLFNRDCVFVATVTGENTGIRSRPELCAARKAHNGSGPLVSYVSGRESANGHSVLVLSRNLTSPTGEFLGGVMSVIELDRAQRRFDAYALGADDSVAMLDEAQVLIARRPLLAHAMEQITAAPNVPHNVRGSVNGSDASVQTDVDGRERIFGFSKIEGFPFVIAYGLYKTRVLQEWQRRAFELGVGYLTLLVVALLAARAHWTMEQQRNELVASRAALQELATHDPLTGLYNRRFLDAALPREIALAQRNQEKLAVIMLDIDHFKKVNDQYGHPAGDRALVVLGELLKAGARESDLICRYGGEEFVAVMPNLSVEQALERAQTWRRLIEGSRIQSGHSEFRMTLSAGIAVYPEHGLTPEALLSRADAMLYKAKQAGRNQVSI